jgi:hypothetical protein
MHCPGYNTSLEMECSGNGACNGATGTCSCQPGWYNEDCQTYCDPSVTCSGHGICSIAGTCECEDGFEGDGCAEKEHEDKPGGHTGVIVGLTLTGALLLIAAVAVFVVIRKRRTAGYTLVENK